MLKRNFFYQSGISIFISKAVETAILNHRYSEDCYDTFLLIFEGLYREKEKLNFINLFVNLLFALNSGFVCDNLLFWSEIDDLQIKR